MDRDTIRHLIREASKSKSLDLSHCNLHVIPDEVFRIAGLKRLLLNNNKLIVLPDSFAQLDSIEYLDLSYNQLQHLPAALAVQDGAPARVINATGNSLESIANELADNFYLRSKIILDGNSALLIPEETREKSQTPKLVPMETQSPSHVRRVLSDRLDQQREHIKKEIEAKSAARDARIQENRVKRLIRSEKDRNQSTDKRSGRMYKDA